MPLIAEFDQLGVVRLLDIVGAHALEHVAEQAELPVGVRGGRPRARTIEHDAWLGGDQSQGYACRCTKKNQ